MWSSVKTYNLTIGAQLCFKPLSQVGFKLAYARGENFVSALAVDRAGSHHLPQKFVQLSLATNSSAFVFDPINGTTTLRDFRPFLDVDRLRVVVNKAPVGVYRQLEFKTIMYPTSDIMGPPVSCSDFRIHHVEYYDRVYNVIEVIFDRLYVGNMTLIAGVGVVSVSTRDIECCVLAILVARGDKLYGGKGCITEVPYVQPVRPEESVEYSEFTFHRDRSFWYRASELLSRFMNFSVYQSLSLLWDRLVTLFYRSVTTAVLIAILYLRRGQMSFLEICNYLVVFLLLNGLSFS
jgi:hypothetical protein